jgi:hypothetical protein
MLMEVCKEAAPQCDGGVIGGFENPITPAGERSRPSNRDIV